MISQQLLDLLRCPLHPVEGKLEPVADGLVCMHCRLKYPVREGIPCMLPEEAELPPGCARLEDLPCKQKSPVEGTS
jgi:uncharacterized protein YbaR (Trm112 family)